MSPEEKNLYPPCDTLRRERISRNWTQAKVGREIGIGETFISKFERGHQAPWRKAVDNLCALFGLSVNELFPEYKGSLGEEDAPLERAFSPHESVTALTKAVVLRKPPGSCGLTIQPIGGSIRYTLDGSKPAATRGFRLRENQIMQLEIKPTQTVTVIQESATVTYLEYQWFD